MRIAIDVRHARDFGIGTYIRNMVHALSRIDEENRYILAGRKEDLREFGELPCNFKRAVFPRSDAGFLNQISFPLFLRRLEPDLCHVPLNAAPLFMPKPYIVTIHDMSSLLFPEQQQQDGNSMRHQYRLFRFRRSLLRANRIIAVSKSTQRDVEDLLRVPQGRIRQIYSAPDPNFLEHAHLATSGSPAFEVERKKTLERYQISYPFLLYAGNVRPQKNVPRLVEAFAVLRNELEGHPLYKDLRLIIIGDEMWKHPQVRRMVIQTRMEPYVRFFGFVPFDTLRIFYSAARVFVFPSLYEGFGMPPLEAMASGTPVVCSGTSSLPEVVGDAAVLVNPENVFDIARGIRDVLLDEKLRTELIARGHIQSRSFHWEQTAHSVLEVYRDAAQDKLRQQRKS
ncbi:glycosyltransferase family 4 protein [Bryobacter aggregatus]|uniref:glycosyltransferase family 4 protein n=1 Tax=Bryobacter aggregatus TaxID=360054 RepID=UPI0004E158C6|nr:glycosyltransferase family 1 protein [Bryobacter aggregatus]